MIEQSKSISPASQETPTVNSPNPRAGIYNPFPPGKV